MQLCVSVVGDKLLRLELWDVAMSPGGFMLPLFSIVTSCVCVNSLFSGTVQETLLTASHLQLQLKNMLHLSHFHFFLRKLTRMLNSGKQFREPVYMTV